MKKLLCFVFGHDYALLRNITRDIREVKCDRCGAEYGMNDNVRVLLPMDNELRKLHEEILNRKI